MSIKTVLRYLPMLLAALFFTQNGYAQKGELSNKTLQTAQSDANNAKQDVPLTFEQVVEAFEKNRPKKVEADADDKFEHSGLYRKDKAHEDEEEHFERWKWAMERHLNEDGTMGSVLQWQEAFQAAKNMTLPTTTNAAESTYPNDPNWEAVGPMGTPANGNPWNQIVGSGRINTIALSRWNTNNIWVGTSSGGIFKTWNKGQSWTNVSLNLPTGEISDIAIDPNDENIIYVATGDWDWRTSAARRTTANGVYKTTDGGTNWWRLNIPTVLASQYVSRIVVHPRENGQLLVTNYDGIFKSDNSGATWRRVSPHRCTDLKASESQPNVVYASSNRRFGDSAEFILKSTNFGNTWDTLSYRFKVLRNDTIQEHEYNARLAVSANSPDTVYILTGYWQYNRVTGQIFARDNGMGYLHRSTDGGKTWQERYNGSKRNTFGSVMGNSDDLAGQAWYCMTLAVDPRNANRVFIGGVNHWGSSDGGLTFSKVGHWTLDMGPSLHADHHTAKFHPITNEYFIGTDGGLFSTKNLTVDSLDKQLACMDSLFVGGRMRYGMYPNCYDLKTDYIDLNSNINNTEFYAFDICRDVPNVIIAGAQDNGSSVYRNGSWVQVLGADGLVPIMHPTNPNIFYASWQNGWMAKTTNGGLTYNFTIADTMQRVDNGPWLTQYAMSPTNPEELISARRDVWRTTNGGGRWTRISNFLAAGALLDTRQAVASAYAPSNKDHIWVVKTGLFKTTNGGTAWTRLTTPFVAGNIRGLAIHPTNPNIVWVTLIGFTAVQKVYKTTDGGVTWTTMVGNLPNTPVNCILLDPLSTDEAVYIGTDIGIFYRNNTLGDWIPYNRQLPIVWVTQLKIQPQQRLLYASTYGRGMWKSQLRDNIDTKAAEPTAQLVTKNLKLSAEQLHVSPNPSVGTVNIVYTDTDNPAKALVISDLYGRQLIVKQNFLGNETLDLKALSTGTYFVKIQTENGLVTQRFVLQR